MERGVERDLQVLGVRRWRELVADRKKMEGHCSTGQSLQWAVVPMEEEDLYAFLLSPAIVCRQGFRTHVYVLLIPWNFMKVRCPFVSGCPR